MSMPRPIEDSSLQLPLPTTPHIPAICPSAPSTCMTPLGLSTPTCSTGIRPSSSSGGGAPRSTLHDDGAKGSRASAFAGNQTASETPARRTKGVMSSPVAPNMPGVMLSREASAIHTYIVSGAAKFDQLGGGGITGAAFVAGSMPLGIADIVQLSAMASTRAGGWGAAGSIVPAAGVANVTGLTRRSSSLSLPVEVPSPPNCHERNAAVASAGRNGTSPHLSSFRVGGSSFGGGRSPPCGGPAAALVAPETDGGLAALEAWRARGTTLRDEAEQMLAAFPRRKSTDAVTFDPSAVDGPWVLSYLSYEPLQLQRSGAVELAAVLSASATKAGALYTATWATDQTPPRTAQLHLRLFVEGAPACIAYLIQHLSCALQQSTPTAEPMTNEAALVTSPEEQRSALVLGLGVTPPPAAAEAAKIAKEFATLQQLPAKRIDLVTFRPPGSPAGAAVRFALADDVATTKARTDEVVVGRILDGQSAMVALLAADTRNDTLRLIGLEKSSRVAAAAAVGQSRTPPD